MYKIKETKEQRKQRKKDEKDKLKELKHKAVRDQLMEQGPEKEKVTIEMIGGRFIYYLLEKHKFLLNCVRILTNCLVTDEIM